MRQRRGCLGPRVRDLVIAAHELAANAVRHGAGQGRLRMWRQGGALHCRVDDSGPPGQAVPAAEDGMNAAAGWPVRQPHGLWLVRRVADQVSIASGPGGTSAMVAFALPG